MLNYFYEEGETRTCGLLRRGCLSRWSDVVSMFRRCSGEELCDEKTILNARPSSASTERRFTSVMMEKFGSLCTLSITFHSRTYNRHFYSTLITQMINYLHTTTKVRHITKAYYPNCFTNWATLNNKKKFFIIFFYYKPYRHSLN